MRKHLFGTLGALTAALLLPMFSACAPYDYSDRVSEIRSDLFLAETDDFSLTLACISREYPYADDGIPCPMSDTIEITLVPAGDPPSHVEVYAAECGGEASFSAAFGDFRFSQGVSTFPEGSVPVRVVWGEESCEIAATSVRTEETLTPNDALAAFVKAEAETLSAMRRDGAFCGEIAVRLLRRDKNYYYAAVTDGTKRIALLLNGETGEVLARRRDTL